MPEWKPKGLSAQTRSAEDQKQIQLQGNDYKNQNIKPLPTIDTYNYMADPVYRVASLYTGADYKTYEKYNETLNNYAEQTANPQIHSKTERNIREIASKVAPGYYNRYNNTDKLSFTTKDWINISNEYNAKKDIIGENAANDWLRKEIEDNVANNQGILEKYWNGFAGIGASAAGSLITLAGNLYGSWKYTLGFGDKTEGLNTWQNYLNNVMDNEITRYGNDIIKYGTFDPNKIDAAKTMYGEISYLPIHSNQEQKNAIFDVNTIPEALSQGGFTVMSMFTGAAAAKVVQWGFKGIKHVALVVKTAKTVDNLNDTKKILNTIQKLEKGAYAIAVPAFAGTTEGLVEGLNTKLEVFDNGKKELEQQQEYYITERAKQLITDNPMLDYTTATKIAYSEYEDKYKEASAYIEAMATKAGINNFYANSAINGILNATLKASLQAPAVQGALQKSKLTSWAFPSGDFKATGTPGNVKVTPKFNKAKQVFNVVKEPFGEFSEEYLQSVSDATMSGVGEYNISKYIENKYKGESVVEIGEYMADSFAAGWNALTNSLTDKETIKSGIYGAISSAVGTFGPSRRTIKLDNEGNVAYKRNKDGSLKRDKSGKPIAETVLFGRGQNAEGELENRWEAFSRAMPWRSGLYSQIKETRNEAKRLKKEAGLIEDWINDPKNQEKFDGVVGTLSWAKDMESSAATSDEFGYRNSVLGKTINDAIMLEKLKGTAFYDSYMNNLSIAANAEKGSKEATDIINSVRQDVNVSSDFENMTDEQVLSRIKDNANKMLNTINSIQKESDNIERILGNVEEDTKISLIYGKMAMEDWNKRKSKLESEINDVAQNIDNTTEQSNLTSKHKDAIATFGSFKKAQKEVEKMKAEMDSLEKDIANLESRKGNIKSENNVLKGKKAKYNSLKKAIKRFSKESEKYEDIENSVLNESEILSLPAEIRAAMLNTENLSTYSEAQQEVINNIINKGTAINVDFSSKIQDAGRIEGASKAYLIQYNNILKDHKAFNNYVTRQKEAANDIISKKRYESISQISEYTQFAKELDNIYDNSSQREQFLIERALKKHNNENFVKYQKQRTDLYNLVNQIQKDEHFNDMDDNDVNLFMHSLVYLSDKGIDISDYSQGSAVLMETDDQGKYLFESYIDEINKTLSPDQKLKFTDIGQVIQTYKDVLTKSNKDITDKEKIEQTVPVEETPVEENTPAEPIEVKVKDTPPEIIEKITPVEEVIVDSPQGEPIKVVESTAVTTAKNLVKNLRVQSADAKNIAQRIIDNAAIESNSSMLIEYLNAEANKLSINSANKVDFEAADLLRRIAIRIEGIEGKTVKETITEEKQPNVFTQSTSNASRIESLDMHYIAKKFPDGALLRFYKRYNVKEFLKSDTLNKNIPVVFILDPQLVNEVKEELKNEDKNYTLTNIPIVAAVEVTSGGITIGDKHYQPIAIMPSTDNPKYSGTARLAPIRKNAYRQSDENQASLIKDENGEIITTNLNCAVVAQQPNHLSTEEPNRSAQTLQINDLEAEDREALTSLSKPDRRNSPIYRRLKNTFLSKLKVVDNKLVYKVSNLKGKVIDVDAFITPIQRTIDKNSNKTIAELFNDNDLSVLKANSRLNRAAKELVKFFKESFNIEELLFVQLEDGTSIPAEQTLNKLNEYSKLLGQKLGNFLNLPSRQGWKYAITPTNEMIGDRRLFELAVENNEGNRIVLGNVTNGTMSENTQMTILKNLIMDEEGNVRMRNSNSSFVIWNVNFKDVENEDPRAKSNMSDIYDDDIIDFSKDSLEYTIKGVVLNAPFTLIGESNYYKEKVQNIKQVSNPATEIPNGSTVKTGDTVVDTDTGVVIEGNTPTSNDTYKYREVEVSKSIFNPDMAPDGSSRIISIDGNYIGEFALYETNDAIHLSGSMGARTEIEEQYRGKGYGTKAYLALANIAKNKGKVLMSDSTLTEDAIRLWESLVKKGYAIKEGNYYKILNDKLPDGNTEETQETKPIGTIKDRRRKKPSTIQPKVERTIPNKFKWGVFEGANMSINEITEALNAQGITTEEQWNNRTDEEMERTLKCCGAF